MSEETGTGAGEPLMDMMAAARYLGVSRSTLQNWVWRGRIPYIRLGGGRGSLVKFRPESLREWVAAHEFKPKEGTP
jgi:excisionase family DNA binding protein